MVNYSLQNQYLQKLNSSKPKPLTWRQHWLVFWLGSKIKDGNHCTHCGSEKRGLLMSIRLKQCLDCLTWYKF